MSLLMPSDPLFLVLEPIDGDSPTAGRTRSSDVRKLASESMARVSLAFLVLGLLFLASCSSRTVVAARLGRSPITQVSVINALMIGRYDGVMPIGELLRHGDFGVGTLDHLDGELIVLDGQAYQVRGDGVVAEVGPERSTPFAVVTRFSQDGEFLCPKVGRLTDLEGRLNDALRHQNHFVAIRVDGRFESITMRSVERQEKPYRPLAEVAKVQSVWTHENVSGTLVGIRCPKWAGGLNVPGYHWHFLSDDRKVGGHVLDCRLDDAQVRYQVCRDWLIKLDGSDDFDKANLGEDHRRDLQRVESSRGERSPASVPGR